MKTKTRIRAVHLTQAVSTTEVESSKQPRKVHTIVRSSTPTLVFCLWIVTPGERNFIQRGFAIDDLQKPRSTIHHWIHEMNLVIADAKNARLVITENDVPKLTTRYSGTKICWKRV